MGTTRPKALETFNYPLNADEIVENYELTRAPNLIPNLLLWLKADAGFFTNALGQVDALLDQSGSGNSATQTTANLKPTYANTGLSGKPAIYFGGTNYFNLPNSMFTSVGEAEAFAALKVETNKPAQDRELWRFSPNGSCRYPYTNGMLADGFGIVGTRGAGLPSQPLDQPHIYSVASKTNSWTMWVNGVVYYTQSRSTPQFPTSGIRIGDGNNVFFAGDIGEVLVFSRVLSARERLGVGTYLSQRYAVATNAPIAPTNLTAFAVATNQVSLAWNSPLTNGSVNFTMQRRTSNSDYSNVAVLQNATSFLDSDLVANTTYYYRVKAANYGGDSAYSAETNATTSSSAIAIPMDSLKVWLKADSGVGENPINCWVDQTTNNNSAYYAFVANNYQPLWTGDGMSNRPAIYYAGTNVSYVPPFGTNWTQGEVFAVLESLGATNYEVGLWWFGSGTSLYPQNDGRIQENFGRSSFSLITGYPTNNIQVPHVYNVMSKSGLWTSRINNLTQYSVTENTWGFPNNPRLGWNGSGQNFSGYIAELMIFDRELSAAERDNLFTNYLNIRFSLP